MTISRKQYPFVFCLYLRELNLSYTRTVFPTISVKVKTKKQQKKKEKKFEIRILQVIQSHCNEEIHLKNVSLSSCMQTTVKRLKVRLEMMQSKTFQLGSTEGWSIPSSWLGPLRCTGAHQHGEGRGKKKEHFQKPSDHPEVAGHY